MVSGVPWTAPRNCHIKVLAQSEGYILINTQRSFRRKHYVERQRRLIASALNVRNPSQLKGNTRDKPLDVDLQRVKGVLESNLALDTSQVDTDVNNSGKTVADDFKSTLSHRFITGGTMLLISSLLVKGVSEIEGPLDFTAGIAAALFAYYLSDFLTGMYHWGVDNYGDGSTPIVGSQIEAFQGHHQKPWTITQREFCNNLYKVFLPCAPFTMACLLISPWTPSWLDIGLATATFLTAMSQQFHAWAHMKPSDLPEPVKVLQDSGVLVSRKAHGAHHKAPFEGNYCIVSGFWNPILDQNGSESSFFRSLERYVKDKTGVEPRCWYEPDYSWQEE